MKNYVIQTNSRRNYARKSEWILKIDCDEFVYPDNTNYYYISFLATGTVQLGQVCSIKCMNDQ